MNVKRRAFPLSIKAVPDAEGRFSGHVSVFGTPDSYREVVAPGAFAASLAATKAAGRTVPVCWQHRMDEPIGAWTRLEEDEKGLFGEGTLWLDVAPYARIAQRGMTAGCISGLSIGYFVTADSFNDVERIRTLTGIELVEASIVTDPAHSEARIDVVKAKLAAGEGITDREFESTLREKGFSRSEAADIAAHGFKAWTRREAGQPQADSSAVARLIEAAGSYRLPSI
ncbi:HK97 family phage prohead protease [Methylobacterium sp. WL6]|uniref:HK97 family phage prohead protease n=1 Tax=Methylobacterium sp. WL6 TaxID=2603901 RepID=UPI0011C87F75|nr:HK97 family phage prohead protease [Methylobacterium sp. WL6]TXN71731.1 HK97 family phage prohead protease [Methylobacterium sp. WL6]